MNDALRQQPFTSGYDAKGSGMLSGGGGTKGNGKRGKVVAYGVRLADSPKDIIANVPTFDPNETYTKNQLLMLAERILLTDEKPLQEHPVVLTASALYRRQKREIQTANGTPDPSIVQGMYWRTHPNGRSANTDSTARREGALAFYN